MPATQRQTRVRTIRVVPATVTGRKLRFAQSAQRLSRKLRLGLFRSRSKRRRRVRFSLSTRRRQRYHAKRSIRRHAGAVAPVCTFTFLIIHLLLLLLLLLYYCCSFTIFIRRLLASRSPTAFHCKQPSVLQTGPVTRVATHVPAANASTAAIVIIITIRKSGRRLPSALTVSTHASVVPETFVALDRFRKVVIHLFDWSSLSSSFISIVFVAFTTRSQHFSPQDYTTTTTSITTPIRAEDDVSTQQHETMNFYQVILRQTFFQFD